MALMLSTHFALSEFRCKCGKCTYGQSRFDVDGRLIQHLEAVRTHFGKPFSPNSGLRCPTYNRKIGGAPNSQHLFGRAADIAMPGHDPAEVAAWIDRQPWASFCGLGLYNTFVHLDVRGAPTRWDNRT